MLDMSDESIETLLNDAMLLHSKINSKRLFIKILNPTFSKLFQKIKSYKSENINIDIEYYEQSAKRVMVEDAKEIDIGVMVIDNSFLKRYTKTLFELKKPIFKIGIWGFSTLKTAVILGSNSENIEKESSVIFDFSSQLDLKIKLYNFNPQNIQSQENLSEHFKNLSKIFNKKVDIIDSKTNPLIKLRNEKDILQFVPFSKKLEKLNIFSIFSTDMEKLHFKLSKSYQVFIPVTIDE
jgi:hypothetical protein